MGGPYADHSCGGFRQELSPPAYTCTGIVRIAFCECTNAVQCFTRKRLALTFLDHPAAKAALSGTGYYF